MGRKGNPSICLDWEKLWGRWEVKRDSIHLKAILLSHPKRWDFGRTPNRFSYYLTSIPKEVYINMTLSFSCGNVVFNICFVCFSHCWLEFAVIECLSSCLSGGPTPAMTFLASFVLMQNLWDMWVHCTQCSWRKWGWVVGAVERGKWCCSCWTCTLSRDQEILAGQSVSQLPAGMYGLCICYIMALPLQRPLLKSDKRLLRQTSTNSFKPLLQVPFFL